MEPQPITYHSQNEKGIKLGICGLENGERHLMAFSDCHPNGFTCTDGSCIDLDAKCDSVVDCFDGSDESDCEFLVVDKDYAKEQFPVSESNEPLRVRKMN